MEQHNLNKLIELYFEDCKEKRRLSRLTLNAYKIDIKQYANFVNSEYMDHKKNTEYIHFLNRQYSKVKTVKRKIASVKAFYSFLEYEEIIETSPFRKLRTQIKEDKTLPKIISTNQLAKIFDYIYQQIEESSSNFRLKICIRNAAIIELLFSSGLRVSELCNIAKNNIDLNERTIKINGKGAKERVLYIGNENVVGILQKYKELFEKEIENSNYFFLNKNGEKLSEQSVRILLNHIEDTLDIPSHITPHMYRHTFATSLLDKGVDIRYIQKILGHSSISITQIYTHVSLNKQKEILKANNPRNDYRDYLNLRKEDIHD